LVHVVSDADRVDYDAGRLSRVGFRLGSVRLSRRRAVGDHDENVRRVISAAAVRAEHCPAGPQRRGEVRLPAVDVDVVDGAQQRVVVVVRVQIENDLDAVAELHHGHLRQVSVDRKGAGDALGEAQYCDVPVVVVGISDNDAC